MGFHVEDPNPSQAWRPGSEASDGKREDKVLVKEVGIPALLLQGSGMVLGKLLFMHNEGLHFPGPQGEVELQKCRALLLQMISGEVRSKIKMDEAVGCLEEAV
ncbi:hypothetical protein DV515_00012105, partial [Chloebia gouldiae]